MNTTISESIGTLTLRIEDFTLVEDNDKKKSKPITIKEKEYNYNCKQIPIIECITSTTLSSLCDATIHFVTFAYDSRVGGRRWRDVVIFFSGAEVTMTVFVCFLCSFLT